MVDLLKLVLFIAIVSSIFFIKSPIILIIVSVALLVLIGILRIDFFVLIKAFIKLLPLLLITFLFNWLLADLSEGIIILSRLLICLCMTFGDNNIIKIVDMFMYDICFCKINYADVYSKWNRNTFCTT